MSQWVYAHLSHFISLPTAQRQPLKILLQLCVLRFFSTCCVRVFGWTSSTQEDTSQPASKKVRISCVIRSKWKEKTWCVNERHQTTDAEELADFVGFNEEENRFTNHCQSSYVKLQDSKQQIRKNFICLHTHTHCTHTSTAYMLRLTHSLACCVGWSVIQCTQFTQFTHTNSTQRICYLQEITLDGRFKPHAANTQTHENNREQERDKYERE